MNEFSISFYQDCNDRICFHELLESNGIEFSVSSDVMESADTTEFITISITTLIALGNALKHLSPVLIEIIKSRKIIVKHGDTEVSVANAKNLEDAIKTVERLSRTQDKQQHQKAE